MNRIENIKACADMKKSVGVSACVRTFTGTFAEDGNKIEIHSSALMRRAICVSCIKEVRI